MRTQECNLYCSKNLQLTDLTVVINLSFMQMFAFVRLGSFPKYTEAFIIISCQTVLEGDLWSYRYKKCYLH